MEDYDLTVLNASKELKPFSPPASLLPVGLAIFFAVLFFMLLWFASPASAQTTTSLFPF